MKAVLKYSKMLGLALILLLFTASFVEWTIHSEFNGDTAQCEETVDSYSDDNDDKVVFLTFFDENLTYSIIQIPQVIFSWVYKFEKTIKVNVHKVSLIILLQQIKIAG
jgi:hypothetical protein